MAIDNGMALAGLRAFLVRLLWSSQREFQERTSLSPRERSEEEIGVGGHFNQLVALLDDGHVSRRQEASERAWQDRLPCVGGGGTGQVAPRGKYSWCLHGGRAQSGPWAPCPCAPWARKFLDLPGWFRNRDALNVPFVALGKMEKMPVGWKERGVDGIRGGQRGDWHWPGVGGREGPHPMWPARMQNWAATSEHGLVCHGLRMPWLFRLERG